MLWLPKLKKFVFISRKDLLNKKIEIVVLEQRFSTSKLFMWATQK